EAAFSRQECWNPRAGHYEALRAPESTNIGKGAAIGAVTGGGFDLSLETGDSIAGADVTGTSVSGVNTLALQNIGGTATFTGAITASTLTVPANVNNVSLTGTGNTVTTAV
ncbi:hypothetical protein, partial [Klebsiella pneumoniae]|uniref:hypothetical protein n=1 Tax=Klebsiella pneumoniae TaxID=573 RepID=UPI003A8A3C08